MNKGEVRLIQADIAFWALLIMTNFQTGWVLIGTWILATVLLIANAVADRALYPREPGSGFWSRVWRR